MKEKERSGLLHSLHRLSKGMVYSIPCSQCPCTNISQTGRSLDVRLWEHRLALNYRDLVASALAEHVFLCDHQVNLSKATVIDVHPHTKTHCMLESWHIQLQQALLKRDRVLCQDSTLHCWTDADTHWGRSATIISAVFLFVSLLFSSPPFPVFYFLFLKIIFTPLSSVGFRGFPHFLYLYASCDHIIV